MIPICITGLIVSGIVAIVYGALSFAENDNRTIDAEIYTEGQCPALTPAWHGTYGNNWVNPGHRCELREGHIGPHKYTGDSDGAGTPKNPFWWIDG